MILLRMLKNVIIKYQRKLDKGKPWKYSPVIDAKNTSFKIDGMKSGEKICLGNRLSREWRRYQNQHLKNGIPQSEELVWSSKGKFQTERSWGAL